jgi:glucan-binding YG repeat protein
MRKQTKLVAVLSAAALLAIGASMTSFAATKWVQEGEDWVYLNSDGERECNVWRRSGDNYYYLNEDGIMAKDTLIKDDIVDATYYVDENGVRITNAWKEIPNDEGAQVGSQNSEDTPEVLYYYFGSAGKAYTAGGEDKKVREINGKYYMFDEEGHMLSGWQVRNNGDTYYLGTEREGWAYTGWQHLEPGDYVAGEDYDELEWFYFGSNGKAKKGNSSYIDGRYYHFNDDGIMDDDWYLNPTTEPSAASAAMAFASTSGTLANGWVYTGDADLDEEVRYDNDDLYWYYLVTVREGGKVARSIPYNYQPENGVGASATEATSEGVARAKVIKNKTYLFDADGKMFKGFVVIKDGETPFEVDGKAVAYNYIRDTTNAHGCEIVERFAGADEPFASVYNEDGTKKIYAGIEGRSLVAGLYYFNEASGSVQGQMQTGRTAITKDGETYYYYFSKDSKYPGYAYTNAVQDGYLYGSDGKCIMAEDGNSYMLYTLPTDIYNRNKKNADGTPVVLEEGKSVIVSRTGKIKTSGTATIDGVKYTVDSKTSTVNEELTKVID